MQKHRPGRPLRRKYKREKIGMRKAERSRRSLGGSYLPEGGHRRGCWSSPKKGSTGKKNGKTRPLADTLLGQETELPNKPGNAVLSWFDSWRESDAGDGVGDGWVLGNGHCTW